MARKRNTPSQQAKAVVPATTRMIARALAGPNRLRYFHPDLDRITPRLVVKCGLDWSTEKVIRSYHRRGFTLIRRVPTFPWERGVAERCLKRLGGSTFKLDELADRIQDAIRPRGKANQEGADVMPLNHQCLEIDKFRLDICLVAEDGTTLYRPWVTVVVDSYSRSVLKAQVSVSPDVRGGN